MRVNSEVERNVMKISCCTF